MGLVQLPSSACNEFVQPQPLGACLRVAGIGAPWLWRGAGGHCHLIRDGKLSSGSLRPCPQCDGPIVMAPWWWLHGGAPTVLLSPLCCPHQQDISDQATLAFWHRYCQACELQLLLDPLVPSEPRGQGEGASEGASAMGKSCQPPPH